MSSTVPPHDPSGPEYLEQGSGAPLPASPGGGRRKAMLAGGAVVGLALAGGGVWAAASFFGTGAQPAEALPASTIGYASIDLDPSGGQKVEAIRMLNEFPAFEDELGLDTDDDIRRTLFEKLNAAEACEGLDYEDDIESWLGHRAAVAAVDTGDEKPTVALVLQVTDDAAAEDGLATLRECGTGDAGEGAGQGGWAVDGDWAVVAESGEIARDLADEAATSSLADDEDYQRWVEEVGDPGVVSVYAAPEAGRFLADSPGLLGGPFGMGPDPMVLDDHGAPMPMEGAEPPAEVTEALENFEGMAATIRFDDGALELEVAGDPGLGQQALYGTEAGDDVLATLPEDTAAAVGIGFADGWFTGMLEQMASYGGGMSVEDLIAEAEAETGLELPDDAETLAGESAALAVGGDFSPEVLFNSADGSDVPIGVKVKGDADAIESVLDKLRAEMGPEGASLRSESDGDLVAIGADGDYLSEILAEGNLGDSEIFSNVVREAGSASAILFVNFRAGDGWLVDAVGGGPEVAENLEPLEGLGMSAWQEDDTSHAVLRITTR